MPDAAPAATAERFVRALQHGAWPEAAALASALTPPDGTTTEQLLRGVWTQLTARLGAIGALSVSGARPDGERTAVDLDASFARSDVTLRVVLAPSGSVSGFWVRPPRPRPWSAPPYADAACLTEHETTVGHGPALPATLTLPHERPAGGAPVVVLVHGSGPSDRDERLGPNRPFKDLAWGLAARGIASLRYDKRSHVDPGGLAGGDVTVEREVIADALTALSVARRNPHVDARRVVLLGHSLGGQLAPEIARRDGRVAGTILLAPGGARPAGAVLLEQLAHVAAHAGAAGGQVERVRPLLAALDARTLAPGADVLGAPASYWYDLADRDGPAAARMLASPLLALFGGRDYQVSDADATVWERALADRPGASVRRFPQADHLFRAGEGMATPSDYLTRAAPVAPEVVDALATWILALAPHRD